jgi:hypothetical protein
MAAKLLFVHSPLVGSGTWDQVAAELSGRGYQVGAADLTGTVTAGPPYSPRPIRRCRTGPDAPGAYL